ncbi:MAG: hypothetical protein WAM60_07850 [Candidatus Promineifilaceae bacterium]
MNDSYWLTTFFRRFGRLLGTLALAPTGLTAAQPVLWLHHLACCLFDLLGGPELSQLVIHALTDTRLLTAQEIEAASAVLGKTAIPYERIRIAQGGILIYAFQKNKNRAFTTWHTINMPEGSDKNLPLLVHELTHTFQFERVGSVYIGQALWEQKKQGREAYHYGGETGLLLARAAGKCYRDYNREQQGQISQDYCDHLAAGKDVSAFAPFIAELRAGKL